MAGSKEVKPKAKAPAKKRQAGAKGAWQQAVDDLESRAWWRSAKVEKIETSGSPRWRVTDSSTDKTELIMAPIARNVRDKAVIFKLKIAKSEAPVNFVSAVRVQLEDTDGKKRYWSVKLNTNNGERSLVERERTAYGQVSAQGDFYAVSVLAVPSADAAVTVRAQIIPASGPSLKENSASTTGDIVVWDPELRIDSASRCGCAQQAFRPIGRISLGRARDNDARAPFTRHNVVFLNRLE